jgi:hypothetical protein
MAEGLGGRWQAGAMPPASGTAPTPTGVPVLAVLLGLGASAVALGLAPALMPDDYSWVANTTSESAAQGLDGAWLGRLGLWLFGLSVLLAASVLASSWGAVATSLHTAFAVLLTASAVFSTRSWRAGAAFDRTEDVLHSVAATAMGFAFALGVVAALIGLGGQRPWRRAAGIVAVAASVVLPLGMVLWPDAAGVLQRAMFAVAYLWYAVEVTRGPGPRSRRAGPAGR